MFKVVGFVTLNEIREAFRSYLVGLHDWRDRFPWRLLRDFDEPAKPAHETAALEVPGHERRIAGTTDNGIFVFIWNSQYNTLSSRRPT